MAPVRALSALAVLAGVAGANAAATPAYNYNKGGQDWGAPAVYSYNASLCTPGSTTSQSPINIADAIVTYAPSGSPLPNLTLAYGQAASWVLEAQRNYLEVANIDTQTTGGSAITANTLTDGITIGGTLIPLNQFHFHSPSEHAINGLHYPLEMHMVHKYFTSDGTMTGTPMNSTGKLAKAAVIGIMFKYSDDDSDGPFLAKLMTAMAAVTPKVLVQANSTLATTETDSDAAGGLFNLMTDIFGPSAAGVSKYYTYSGSLTTPGCSQNITWFNMATPLTASRAQILNFTYLLSLEQKVYGNARNGANPFGVSRGGDNRLVQPLNGRSVYASWSLPAGSQVVITAYATLTGVTSATFTTALRNNFISVVAAGVSLPTSAVSIVSVSDVSVAGRRHLLASGVAVTYTITAPTATAGAAARTALAAFTSTPAGGVSPFSTALATATGGTISGATSSSTNPVVSAAPARSAAVLMSVVAAAFALAF